MRLLAVSLAASTSRPSVILSHWIEPRRCLAAGASRPAPRSLGAYKSDAAESQTALTELDALAYRVEIAASKRACEVLAGAEVRTFAYPFGNFDAEVRAAIRDAGFICACSTRHGPVVLGCDVFALPRVQVLDSCGDVFEQSLRYASIAHMGA